MAKKFFGGKEKGRFSGENSRQTDSGSDSGLDQELNLDLELERELEAALGDDLSREDPFSQTAFDVPEPSDTREEPDFQINFDFDAAIAEDQKPVPEEPVREESAPEEPAREKSVPEKPVQPESGEDIPSEPDSEKPVRRSRKSDSRPAGRKKERSDVDDMIAQIDGDGDEFLMDYSDTQDLPEQMGGTPAPRAVHASDEEPPKGRKKKEKKQKKPALRIWTTILSIILFLEAAYCVVIFTDWIKPIAALRSIYIDTAMVTMRHQYLATWLIPGDVVMKVVARTEAHKEAQMGVDSSWDDVDEVPKETKSPSSGFHKDAAATILSQIAQDVGLSSADDEFFELFHELDEASVRAYAEAHPEVIANGWENFYVHEAGLDDEGTDMVTTQGDQVLAIDAAHGLMVIRVTGSTYKGVLVFGKDPSRLKCAPSSQWGTAGEWAGTIAENNNGLVAMTGSGFGDSAYVSEGADQSGAAMCSGERYGYHFEWGYKRVELHKDNRLYIVDAQNDYSPDCTDATEWTPALIVDGVNVSGEDYTYTSLNPRTCLGQTRDETILMLGIEGRYWDSLGCNAVECANILERYGAYQAMNVDGGTSSSVWYEGEYIIRCSNSNLVPEGRNLPNAWVYCDAPVPQA